MEFENWRGCKKVPTSTFWNFWISGAKMFQVTLKNFGRWFQLSICIIHWDAACKEVPSPTFVKMHARNTKSYIIVLGTFLNRKLFCRFLQHGTWYLFALRPRNEIAFPESNVAAKMKCEIWQRAMCWLNGLNCIMVRNETVIILLTN